MMIFLFFAIVTVILGLVHLAIYKAVISIFVVTSPAAIVWLRSLLVVLAASFIAASVLTNYFDTSVTRIFYRATAIWIGFVSLLFLASCMYGIIAGIAGLVSPSFLAQWIGMALFAVALAAGIYGLIHAETIVVRHETVSIPGLPSAWQGARVVVVSDIHLGQVHGREYAARVVALIQSLNPDAIFIPGDLFDGPKMDEIAAAAPFKELHPRLGMYFSTGNHEEFGESGHFLRAIGDAGIRILADESVIVEGLQIVGVNDKDSIREDRYAQTLDSIVLDPDKPAILLKHQPTLLDLSEKKGFTLQLSGHTHRAQMWPWSLLTPLIFHGYDYGLKKYGAMDVLTSSGAGTWGPPMRLGTDSEIVVLTFR